MATFQGSGDVDVFIGTNDPDLFNLEGGDDYALGNGGNDTAFGGQGKDFIFGGAGADLIFGNRDTDFLSGGAGADTVFGGQQTDYVWGNGGADALFGNMGNDYVNGGAGDDSVWGGQGNDNLFGGAGNDLIYGDYGSDIIQGGDGTRRGDPDGFDVAAYNGTLSGAANDIGADGTMGRYALYTTRYRGFDDAEDGGTIESFGRNGNRTPNAVVVVDLVNGDTDVVRSDVEQLQFSNTIVDVQRVLANPQIYSDYNGEYASIAPDGYNVFDPTRLVLPDFPTQATDPRFYISDFAF